MKMKDTLIAISACVGIILAIIFIFILVCAPIILVCFTSFKIAQLFVH